MGHVLIDELCAEIAEEIAEHLERNLHVQEAVYGITPETSCPRVETMMHPFTRDVRVTSRCSECGGSGNVNCAECSVCGGSGAGLLDDPEGYPARAEGVYHGRDVYCYKVDRGATYVTYQVEVT